MRPPCEEIFKEALPTIRAILVKDLVERHNLNQVEVARRLGITQPAVSQYLRSLRGAGRLKAFLKKRAFMRSLTEFSDAIAGEETKVTKLDRMYCDLCAMLKKKK